MAAGPGFQVSLGSFIVQRGPRSLRVNLDGSADLDFASIWQQVQVEPRGDFRCRGYIKAENVTTDSGLRFSIVTVAALPEESFGRYTESRAGTELWTLEQLGFRTDPNVRMASVASRRLPSRKLNNLIQEEVWMITFR